MRSSLLLKRRGERKKLVQVKQVRESNRPETFFPFQAKFSFSLPSCEMGKKRDRDVGIPPTALILPLYPGDNRRPARRRLELREGKEGGRYGKVRSYGVHTH